MAYWFEAFRTSSFHMTGGLERTALIKDSHDNKQCGQRRRVKAGGGEGGIHTLTRQAALEETALTACNATIVRKWAEMGLDGLVPEAAAPTDVAGPRWMVYFYVTHKCI